MPDDVSAKRRKSEEIIYRDRQGRKIPYEEWIKQNEPKRREKPTVPWTTGLVQQQALLDKAKLEEEIIKAPFTQHEISDKYDAQLRSQIREGDPLQKKSKRRTPTEKDTAATDAPKSCGRLYCLFSGPGNRFNIKPGYRWDGVVRGNGYEERIMSGRARR